MFVRRFVLALTLLTCAALLSSPPASAGAGPPRAPALPAHRLYVIDPYANVIDVFPAGVPRPKLAGKITSGITEPTDLFVDRAGTLYVLEQYRSIKVAIFPRGSTSPSRFVSFGDTQSFASNVTVSPNGTIAVSGYNVNTRAYSVLELPQNGGGAPFVLTFPKNVYPGGLAADARDLYVSVGDDILVYPLFGATSIGDVPQSPKYSVGALEFDDLGRLIVGRPYSLNDGGSVAIETLPKGTVVHSILTAGAGDYVAYDRASNLMYAISGFSQTLQTYNATNGKWLDVKAYYSSGIAVDPGTAR